MVFSLWLPIILSAITLFFASFLSWMVLQLHKQDWGKLPDEDEFLKTARAINLAEGSYMFPMSESPNPMKDPEYTAKWEQGPRGIVSVYPPTNMGQNLALTFVYFLVASFCIAYLATIAFQQGTEVTFWNVFRFVATAGLLTFLTATVGNAIWFRARIVGHVIESVAYAAIIGVIFAALWPT